MNNRQVKNNRQGNRLLAYLKSPWTPAFIITFIILLILGSHFYIDREEENEDVPEIQAIQHPVDELTQLFEHIFREYGLTWKKKANAKLAMCEWHVTVPIDLPVPSLHLAIQEKIQLFDARIILAKEEPLLSRVSINIGWGDSVFCMIYLHKGEKKTRQVGKIALIVDDFGSQFNSVVESLLQFGGHITISVIPGERFSTKITQEARKRGCEVILHLPMEPLSSPFKDNGYIIVAKMPRYKIRDVIQRSLETVPGVLGVNNHMGSRVTSDRHTITDVLVELKKRDLYFLDSRTVSSSVAYDIAKELEMQCGKRDVFFDVDSDKHIISQRIEELAHKARTAGFSIGIGHCNKSTYDVLAEEIPKWQKKGFKFVTLSEVIR